MAILLLGTLLLALAAFSDIRTKKIPLWMIGLTGVCALAAGALSLTSGKGSVSQLCLSCVPGMALLLLGFVTKQSVGYGDGLLMMAAGPMFGAGRMFSGMMLAFLLSAVVSVALLAVKKVHRKTRIPFVPFLATAMGVVSFVLV